MFDQRSWMEEFFHGPGVRHVCLAYNGDSRVLAASVNSSKMSASNHMDGEDTRFEPEDGERPSGSDVEDDSTLDYPYGPNGPMSALWKYVYFVNQSNARIPESNACYEEFSAELLDEVGRILSQHEDAVPPEGETWKHLADTTVEAEQQGNIKWCLFLHSVKENLFGMIDNRCIWFCRQHHRHQLCDTTTLEWLGLSDGFSRPCALKYSHEASLWQEMDIEIPELANQASSLALSAFDEEYQQHCSGTKSDGGFCYVSVSIGMEVKVVEVSEKRIEGAVYYDMKPLGAKLPCQYFGETGTAIRLHWSTEGAHKLRNHIRQAYNEAKREHPVLERLFGNSSAVIDRMNTIYPAWGCGKKVLEDEEGNAVGRPSQTKSGLQLFGNHLSRLQLRRCFCRAIENRRDLDREAKDNEIRKGLFNLLLPTARDGEESSGSYPVLNIYEGVYRAAPKKKSVLRDGSGQFITMAKQITGADQTRRSTGQMKASLIRFVHQFQKEIWEWHNACPMRPVLRVEDCSMTRVLVEGPHISVDRIEQGVTMNAFSRIANMIRADLKDYLVYSRRFELEETVVNTVPVFTAMCRRGEHQLETLGRVDPSLVDHLALLIGLVQHVIFGWDRLSSAMKKYFNTSPAAKFLRDHLEKYGFICALPATFFFGGAKGFDSCSIDAIGRSATWNVVNHMGMLSFLSQKALVDSLRTRGEGSGSRWDLLSTVLSDVLHHLDITLWPRLMMELLAINLLELLCVHSDFGMAVEVVTSHEKPVGYRMRALWKVFGYGDCHAWQFVERCLPSISSTPLLEHRASSFLCPKAMKQIAEITRVRDVSINRTVFAGAWMDKLKNMISFRTGGIIGNGGKDIHRVMFSCMFQELKRYEMHSEVRGMSASYMIQTLVVHFMHLLPCEYWAHLRRSPRMRESEETINLQKLGPSDPNELNRTTEILQLAQSGKEALLRKGGFLQGDHELSNLLANQWLDTALASSFSLMHYPDRRMNEMDADNILFVQLAEKVPSNPDDPSSTYCPDFGDGPGTRAFGARRDLLHGEYVYRNGLLLVKDTDMAGIPTKFVKKK